MSFTQSINIKDYVNRSVDILRNNASLKQKVSQILSQEPPIVQSPQLSVMPVIFVAQSKSPIRAIKPMGRDNRNTASARMYSLEFYNVVVARAISKQMALEFLQDTEYLIRDTYMKNQRMTDDAGENPMSLSVDVVSVPFIIQVNDPNIAAINVITRPEVPVKL